MSYPLPCWAVALLALSQACSWGCAGSPLTPSDNVMLGAESSEQTSCVIDNRGDAGAIDRCRAQVRAKFDQYWREHFDGGRP